MYQYVLRPFVNVPIELKDDWTKTHDEMNFDTIAEAEVVAQEEVNENANAGKVIDIPKEEVKLEEPKTDIPEQVSLKDFDAEEDSPF